MNWANLGKDNEENLMVTSYRMDKIADTLIK